eukprot:scaffold217999_cov35-Tisochrysis_lutea.AAC.2
MRYGRKAESKKGGSQSSTPPRAHTLACPSESSGTWKANEDETREVMCRDSCGTRMKKAMIKVIAMAVTRDA